jgi:hypothetical protein
VSLPWKSELTLRLSRQQCEATLAQPWSRRVMHEVKAQGDPAASIPGALYLLLGACGDSLPGRARLLVADEYAYLRLRPARPTWSDALRDAREHFEPILGDADCRVQVAQWPMGPWWLAAAMHGADLEAWAAAAALRGVVFDSVEPALLEDLRALAPRVGDRGVLALLRDEGVALVRISGGAPVELAWERCDPHAPRCIEHRVLAFQNAPAGEQPDPLAMVCRDEAQADIWKPQASAYGWTLVSPAPRSLTVPPRKAA